jgi:hypothetical protein
MHVVIRKHVTFDEIEITRADGTRCDTRFPKKGPVPHDGVHYLVEDALALACGFWGLIAAGHTPGDIQQLAMDGGHASASRAQIPDAAIVQLIQAERLVECFEAELWSGCRTDPDVFRSVAQAACDESNVAMPSLDDAVIAKISDALARLKESWVPAPVGHGYSFVWPQ